MVGRLTAGIWVEIYFARLRQAAIAHHLVHRGDATAGAVAVKLATLDGAAALFARATGPDGEARWVETKAGAEAEVDAVIARQRARDPDLWVIEVEDRAGRTLLDEPGLD